MQATQKEQNLIGPFYRELSFRLLFKNVTPFRAGLKAQFPVALMCSCTEDCFYYVYMYLFIYCLSVYCWTSKYEFCVR
jgi:hypothetical protein